ncbi:CHAT domain-containing protein [Lentzea alba]|uniref:CHAT domain-containing protein n=1 Tax=Lentzea alba TaxID=2714351 RepID=UPI0039BF5866
MGWLDAWRTRSLNARYRVLVERAERDGVNTVQHEAWQLITDCLPRMMTSTRAAVVASATIRLSLPSEAGARNWHRTMALGWVSAAAVAALDLHSGFNPRLMGGLARDLFRQAEIYHFAAHRANVPAVGAVLAETLCSLRLGERMLSRSIAVSGERGELPKEATSLRQRLAGVPVVELTELPAFTGNVDDLADWFDRCLREAFREGGEEAGLGLVRVWGVNVLMEAVRTCGRSVLYVSGGIDAGVATLVDAAALDDPARPVTTSIDLPGAGLINIGQQAVGLFTATSGRRTGTLDGSAFDKHVTESLNWVGETIWLPILEKWPQLRTQPVAVVPLGECGMLPFYTAIVDGRPACTLLDLTIAPSGRSLVLAGESSAARGEAFVAADPSSGAAELRYVAHEAAAVADVLDARPFVVGQPGSAETDVVARIRDSAVVHLACHGVVRPDEPVSSSIVLGEHIAVGTMLEEDLRHGSLVVLSACDLAGIGTGLPGEQLGFPAVLLAGGARTVVAALWPVPDTRRTVRMMTRFHQEALTTSPTKALAAAIGHAHKSGVPPTLWAAFACYGA